MPEFSGHDVSESLGMDELRTWRDMSVSVDDPGLERRQQTWADEGGCDRHLIGAVVDGHPPVATSRDIDEGGATAIILTDPRPVDAHQRCERTVSSNTTDDTVDRRWDSSPDEPGWTQRSPISSKRRA